MALLEDNSSSSLLWSSPSFGKHLSNLVCPAYTSPKIVKKQAEQLWNHRKTSQEVLQPPSTVLGRWSPTDGLMNPHSEQILWRMFSSHASWCLMSFWPEALLQVETRDQAPVWRWPRHAPVPGLERWVGGECVASNWKDYSMRKKGHP